MEEKRLAIAKAYGIHFNELSGFLDENGWLPWSFRGSFGDKDACTLAEIEKYVGKYPNYDKRYNSDSRELYFRPLSLKNLENNNGWTIINSEEDLKEHVACDTQYIKCCHITNKTFDTLSAKDVLKLYKKGCVTHFVKPIPMDSPLY